MYEFLLAGTAAIIVAFMVYTYKKTQDLLHPIFIYGGLLLGLYVLWPITLIFYYPSEYGVLDHYFSPEQIIFSQFVYLLFIISFLLGCSSHLRISHIRIINLPHTIQLPSPRLRRFAIQVGLIGVLIYVHNIQNVGGFYAAYDNSYGGGWSDVGWVREVEVFSLTGAILLLESRINRLNVKQFDYFYLLLFVTPLLIHSLLGGRRSPLFLVLVSLYFCVHLANRKRPGFAKNILIAIIVPILMLFLVSNRSNIYIGTTENFNLEVGSYFGNLYQGAWSANEYVFSSGLVQYGDEVENFWGGRYAAHLLVRPIPSIFWTVDKYAFASKFFDIPNLPIEGAYFRTMDFFSHLLWLPPKGAAAGLLADLWVELWWFGALLIYFVGYAISLSWYNARTRFGVWISVYSFVAGYSVFLVWQDFISMLFRFMVAMVPLYIIGRRQYVIMQRHA